MHCSKEKPSRWHLYSSLSPVETTAVGGHKLVGVYAYANSLSWFHVHTYVHAYVHTYMHTYICTCIRTYVHAYVHMYMHTYIHLHIYTHAHMCLCCTYVYIWHDVHTYSTYLVFLLPLTSAGQTGQCLHRCHMPLKFSVHLLHTTHTHGIHTYAYMMYSQMQVTNTPP